MRTMSRITRKHKVVCLHVISVPYHADGVNLQHAPSDQAACVWCGFDLGKVVCSDASVVFWGCPISMSHAGMVGGSWLQPVRQDDVMRVVIMRGCAGVVLEIRGGLRRSVAEFDGVHVHGHPLVKYDIACRLAKSMAFVIGDVGYHALMFVCLALACGVSGDAIEGIV